MTFLDVFFTAPIVETAPAPPSIELILTDNCGPLTKGDVFRIGQEFYKITNFYGNHVETWGGSKNPEGNRAFKPFTYEFVIANARPLSKGQRWIPTQYAALMLEGRKEARR